MKSFVVPAYQFRVICKSEDGARFEAEDTRKRIQV